MPETVKGENETEGGFKPTPMNEILRGVSMFVPDEVEFPDDDDSDDIGVPMADLLYAAGSATQQPSGKYRFETINGRRVARPVKDGGQQQQASGSANAQPNVEQPVNPNAQPESPDFMDGETKPGDHLQYQRSNYPNEPVREKFTMGDVDFKVISGSEEDGARVREATEKVLNTARGKQILDKLGERAHLWGLINTNFDLIIEYNHPSGGKGLFDFIVVDPRTNKKITTADGDEIVGTLTRMIAHELGHSIGYKDIGPNGMENINLNENPVMRELGEPERGRY